MEELGRYLIDHNISIASAESFTVGGFANRIGSIPGISKVYRGSVVTYQTEMKRLILGIDQTLIDQYGVVSAEIAKEMATHGKTLFNADLCISFTGNSGPLPMEDKPVGLCYMAIAWHQKVLVYTLHLSGSRIEIQEEAIQIGSSKLKELLNIKEEEKHG